MSDEMTQAEQDAETISEMRELADTYLKSRLPGSYVGTGQHNKLSARFTDAALLTIETQATEIARLRADLAGCSDAYDQMEHAALDVAMSGLREENERLRGLLEGVPEMLEIAAVNEVALTELTASLKMPRAEAEAAELRAKAAAIRAALGESDGTP